MSREIKRVPMDFAWPTGEVWQGYLMPEDLRALDCPECAGDGYSAHARHLKNLWYGYVPFAPEDNGSTPLTEQAPEVDAFARRNVASSPDYYGADPQAVTREARRLARLWNRTWSHHLNVDDVAALVGEGRLYDLTHTWTRETRWQPKEPPVMPTPAEVNAWSVRGLGHGSLNAHVVIQARCEREGAPFLCGTCRGSGERWRDDEHRQAHEVWEQTEPPVGEGWQAWETVSEGSPISPVFGTAEELVQWAAGPDGTLGVGSTKQVSEEAARAFVGAGWAPSLVSSPETGVQGGVEAMAARGPR